MNYLKYTITILIASLSLSLYGQTQIAFVKTRGRMVNGVHVPGHGLQGATVDIQDGNTYLVQNEDGSFSFPVPSQSFEVKSVLKKDYELIDQDILKRLHHYSSDPLYIVMEKPEQQKQDLLESERNIRRTLQSKLQQREEELDSLREAHQITTKEYQDALQELYTAQKDNEKLISDMAKEYAKLDYDQMTELNRRINDAISNGRLSQADSLIHTKGSIQSRIEKVKHEEQVLKEREIEIEEAKRDFDDAKAGTIKEKKEIAEDCITLKDRFMLELNIDSATYYMEQLVSLDSTDAENLFVVAIFYHNIVEKYDKAEFYYQRALEIYQRSFDDYAYEICAIKYNLADISYRYHNDYSKAEELYKENIEIIKRAGGKIESKRAKGNVIDEYYNQLSLANLYRDNEQDSKADSLFLNILELLQKGYYNYDYVETQARTAFIYMNCGNYSYDEGNDERGDSLLMMAINIYRRLSLLDSFYYHYLGINILAYASCYEHEDYFYEFEPLLLEGLDAANKSTNPKEYKEMLIAQIQFLLGTIYRSTQRPLESEKMYKDALTVIRRYASAIPGKYYGVLNSPIQKLANLYLDMGRIDESETLYEEALIISSTLALTDPQEFTIESVRVKRKLARIKFLQRKYHEAESLCNDALKTLDQFAGDQQAKYYNVMGTMEILGSTYLAMGDSLHKAHNYSESEIYYLKALDITEQLHANDSVFYDYDLAVTLERIAANYWDAQHFQEAEAMFDRFLDITKRMAEKDYDFQLTYTNLVYKLSQLYPQIKNYKAAYKVGNEWLPLLKKQAEEYPDLMLKDYAECLGNQSFYAIFQGQYAQAEQLARDGLEIDSTLHWIAANLASALLFQGKYKDAEKICRQYKDELKDTFLENFSQFDQAGVIPKKREKDVAKIKKLLNQKDN